MSPEARRSTAQIDRGRARRRDVLSVERLRVQIPSSGGMVHAVQDVSLRVAQNELVGLVGESGSGKTMTALAVIGLLPRTAQASGVIDVNGASMLELNERRRAALRGAEVAMVFQDAASYLNPLMRVGEQVAESFRLHQPISRAAARAAALEILGEMKLPNPRRVSRLYPFQLSGGQRQRVLIAIALACRPALVIADEPTSALDVVTQEQILELLQTVVRDFDTSLLMITHDLAIIGSQCDRVYVMYAGQIMESAAASSLLARPSHPYTVGLSRSMLTLDEYKPDIPTIPGSVPDLRDPAPGCPFAPRCRHAWDKCDERPPRLEVSSGHDAACWLFAEGGK